MSCYVCNAAATVKLGPIPYCAGHAPKPPKLADIKGLKQSLEEIVSKPIDPNLRPAIKKNYIAWYIHDGVRNADFELGRDDMLGQLGVSEFILANADQGSFTRTGYPGTFNWKRVSPD